MNFKSHASPDHPLPSPPHIKSPLPSAPPLYTEHDQSAPLLETDNKDGVTCGKVKGYLNVDFQVSGLTKKETGFIRLICCLIISETFHNVPVPSEYLASLVSELYKRFKHNGVTYTPGVKGNLLWGKTNLKWMTGSCITPINFLNRNSDVTHAFPMTASLDTIVHVKFNASLKTRPYLNSEAVRLQEASFAYVETFFKRLECKDEILFMLQVKQNTILFNFNSVLQKYSEVPSQPVGRGEQSFHSWDITPIRLYRKANFIERVLSSNSSQKALQLHDPNTLPGQSIKFPWK